MPTTSAVRVRGLRELQSAFRRTSRDVRARTRDTFKDAAEPVRRDAESYARSEVSRIGDKWPQMRVGVTTKVVYVAPKQRGRLSRRNPSLRRPNLADLLMTRAMEPALEQNTESVARAVEHALDQLADQFNG